MIMSYASQSLQKGFSVGWWNQICLPCITNQPIFSLSTLRREGGEVDSHQTCKAKTDVPPPLPHQFTTTRVLIHRTTDEQHYIHHVHEKLYQTQKHDEYTESNP
uniref:Uncharacterized protein n=1 Tax=Percolomonas cosmopolitus TaxID=63605 RepID=A0A7S1KRH5_9EUKA|mmetsp:Transcript_5826/g.22125  ORF Transcript_5826/g.22125 Transcript_5826/m.22125 type:complete len:104 (+) Transcript_5826:123-434(+)